jgi:hypothetical protein
MCRTYFLIATGLGEGGTGLLLLGSPSVLLRLLLGVDQASPEESVVARIAGAALLTIGVACWMGRNDHTGHAQNGLMLGILIYDLAAAGILGHAGWFLGLVGTALWPAVGLHIALAVTCVACIPRSNVCLNPAPPASRPPTADSGSG